MSKGMLFADCAPLDEIYTHIDNGEGGTGKVRHFNASAMNRDAKSLEATGAISCITAAMDMDFVRFIVEHRGVEDHKIRRLVEPYLSTPIIGVALPDDVVLTVDGHHRLVRLALEQHTTYRMYLFPEGVWGRYLIQDLDDEFSDFIADFTLAEQGAAPEHKKQLERNNGKEE